MEWVGGRWGWGDSVCDGMGWDGMGCVTRIGFGLWRRGDGKGCLWEACIEKKISLITVMSLFCVPVPVPFGFVSRLRAEVHGAGNEGLFLL